MEVVIVPDAAAQGEIVADAVVRLAGCKPDFVIGLATGSSPLAAYDAIVEHHRAGKVSFAAAQAFTLDEYVGLTEGHPESYHAVIERDFASRVDLPLTSLHCPDGRADDLERACAEYEDAMRRAGGVDLQILGIGTDGHIAFNEPGSSLASRTRMKTLTAQTRRDNARFFDGLADRVPRHCLTQGLGTIMEARHIMLLATGEGKSEAVRHLVEGAVSAMWPATVLQFHPRVTVLLDEPAASKLRLSDYYREAWEGKSLGA